MFSLHTSQRQREPWIFGVVFLSHCLGSLLGGAPRHLSFFFFSPLRPWNLLFFLIMMQASSTFIQLSQRWILSSPLSIPPSLSSSSSQRWISASALFFFILQHSSWLDLLFSPVPLLPAQPPALTAFGSSPLSLSLSSFFLILQLSQHWILSSLSFSHPFFLTPCLSFFSQWVLAFHASCHTPLSHTG